MGPFAIAALGAGALVTTAAAGIVLLRRKVLGKAVQVDVEKGLEENILERREGTGPGWKEYVEVDEKATSELLVPLVGAFHAQKETDVVDANPFQAPLTLKPPLAALNQCPDPPARSVRHQFGPIPVPMGDISDTHNWDHAPVFPPGLPVPARAVAVARPISARLHPLSELGPLDTGVSGITSWPVLAPTPIEEMRARSDGQGEQVQLDVKDDVAPQDDLSASSPEFPREQPIAPSSLGLPVSSGIIDESGEVDPFGDPTDSVHSPLFRSFPRHGRKHIAGLHPPKRF
ncbi:hypothetical protein OPQ81_003564 [Rhizoctonia solani]|nr:hypothetical protein OPQ81_003564 [Rhizoctonia solani]